MRFTCRVKGRRPCRSSLRRGTLARAFEVCLGSLDPVETAPVREPVDARG